jgi:hypothetical protein
VPPTALAMEDLHRHDKQWHHWIEFNFYPNFTLSFCWKDFVRCRIFNVTQNCDVAWKVRRDCRLTSSKALDEIIRRPLIKRLHKFFGLFETRSINALVVPDAIEQIQSH